MSIRICWTSLEVTRAGIVFAALMLLASRPVLAQDAKEPVVPHGQSQAPGPALSPAEAIARMKVPEGFHVELVAAEPDIVNPVAMTFDERGRVWITESFEYPRKEAGPGRDRIKILEDTDGDGRADKFTVFADGLNIPSGIAVGGGGVWVANAPDILFLQDTDGDDRADTQEIVVTGFGRDDTHELPNSLTWGPDGWLYGLNGVFNVSRVEQGGREQRFTAAMFRIHPRTHKFELFAEGTSNPWGIAWDGEGSAFLSACVIDHLWHLTQSGYYQRQAGAYPPFAWKIGSIVNHKHQQAAYCGIHYFNSDAYPAQYRHKLYMGNIHGNCINSDSLTRDGSTYAGHAEPDFLTANDAWFMPVVQKTGPDGCLYILDWYDRYHCYQDANRDPQGIDRAKGRLYRVRYQDSPRAPKFDLARESDPQLISRLNSPNIFFRDIAQRLLAERNSPESRGPLETLVLDDAARKHARMHALWALVSAGPLEPKFHARLLDESDPSLRAWGVRAAGAMGQVDPALCDRVVALARDPAADVRLQVAIAAARLEGVQTVDVLVDVLTHSSGDKLIPPIVWQNLHPKLEAEQGRFLAAIEPKAVRHAAAVELIVPRALERFLATSPLNAAPVAKLVTLYLGAAPEQATVARQILAMLAAKIQSGEVRGENLDRLRTACQGLIAPLLDTGSSAPLHFEAALLAVSWNDPAGMAAVRRVLATPSQDDARRLHALEALIVARDPQLLESLSTLFAGSERAPAALRRRALEVLVRSDEPKIADLVLEQFPQLEPDLRPLAIDLLTTRAVWSRAMLASIASGKLDRAALGANQVRKLLAGDDPELRKQVTAVWGALRTERDPQRDQVIARTRRMIRREPGDPAAGQLVFQKVCANCHKIYGKGQEVGPDITVNGRGSFEQLLSNVLDPSLVIGAAYQARIVSTDDGRVLTGLLVEDSPERVVLKRPGGDVETIPRDVVDQIETSRLSLMPEDLDKQLTPREMANLFAFLSLDKLPEDRSARFLPGADAPTPRQTSDPQQFAEVIAEVAPGFTTRACGEGGVAIVKEHRGRLGVLRTHPPQRGQPCVLRGTIDVPEGRTTRLVVEASYQADADWRLVIRADGKTLYTGDVSARAAPNGWLEVPVDLTSFAGQKPNVEIWNQPTGWSNEFAYWGAVDIISQ